MTLAIYDREVFGGKTFQFTQVDLVPSSFTWSSAPSLDSQSHTKPSCSSTMASFCSRETNPKAPWELFPFHMEAILILGPHESSQGSHHLHWV